MLSYRVSVRPIALVLFITLTATAAAARQRTDFGTLSIQVRPPSAEILIDGERWTGPEGPGPLQVQLSPGSHRVEIRSPGRQAFAREVIIRAGETLPLNVALTQGQPEAAPPDAPAPRAPKPPAERPPVAPSGGIVPAGKSGDGFVIAPDFRVTDINHQTGALVGVYGGYVFAGQFLAGAGAYWQANSTDGTRLAYGGPVVEWRMFTDRTIGFNLHGLVGAGWRYADYYWAGPYNHYGPPGNAPYGWPYTWYDTVFFVAEPEAQVVVRFGPSVRLQGGLGYRATSSGGASGASGSISVQIGR